MKTYPSIEYKINGNIDVYGFDKLDGSNIRAEWSVKNGFYKFGARHRLLDENEEPLGEAVDLINNKYGEDLSRIFYDNKYGRAITFFEFLGPNSFAGNHEEEDHDVTLIDVNPYKRGILAPPKFIKTYGDAVEIPNVVFHGRVGIEFVEAVRESKVDGITFEGVVFKGVRKGTHLSMFKVKSKAWIDKVKTLYHEDSYRLGQLLDKTELMISNSKGYRQRRFCPVCFRSGSLSPKCKCGSETLKMEFEAQPPRKRASKARWKKFFRLWYPEFDFNTQWNNR
jgi:hypothetical protein